MSLLMLKWIPPLPRTKVCSMDISVLEDDFQIVSDHLLITNFIGPSPNFGFLEPWMVLLNYEIKQGNVTFNHELGHGFFLSQM